MDLISNWLLYGAILLLIIFSGVLLVNRQRLVVVSAIHIGLIAVVTIFFYATEKAKQSIISWSPSGKHAFVLKENNKSENYYYFNHYYRLFVKAKEELSFEVTTNYQATWLGDETCVFTYETTDQSLHQYIGTYGGQKQSYAYVTTDLIGQWQSADGAYQLSYQSTRTTNSNSIELLANGQRENFAVEQLVQFGVTSAVLTDESGARWALTIAAENTYSNGELVKNGQTKLLLKESSLAEDSSVVELLYVGE